MKALIISFSTQTINGLMKNIQPPFYSCGYGKDTCIGFLLTVAADIPGSRPMDDLFTAQPDYEIFATPPTLLQVAARALAKLSEGIDLCLLVVLPLTLLIIAQRKAVLLKFVAYGLLQAPGKDFFCLNALHLMLPYPVTMVRSSLSF